MLSFAPALNSVNSDGGSFSNKKAKATNLSTLDGETFSVETNWVMLY